MVARALEAHDSGGGGDRAAEIAHHYLAAAHPDAIGRALEFSRQAYAQAMGKLAWEDAAAIARRAVTALDATPADGPLGTGMLSLLLALGEAESRAGDSNAARATFGRAAQVAATAGDTSGFAEAALGFAGPTWRTFGEVDQDAVGLLDTALQRLPAEEAALRAALRARLAVNLYFARQPDRVAKLTDAAVAGARQLPDPEVLAAALEARLWAHWHPDGVGQRLDTARELLQLAEQHHLDEWSAVARRWRVVALLEDGRLAEAWAEVDAHARAAHTLRLPYELMYTAVFATMRALFDGRLEDAARESARVSAFGELRGGADALQFVGVHQLTFRYLRGEMGSLVDGLRGFADGYPAVQAWRAGVAYALSEAGRPAAAAAEIDPPLAAGIHPAAGRGVAPQYGLPCPCRDQHGRP